jgi:tetratricopeptide (TPR) repeat protein
MLSFSQNIRSNIVVSAEKIDMESVPSQSNANRAKQTSEAPILLIVLLLVIAASAFSPWILNKIDRESPPPAKANETQAQSIRLRDMWQRSIPGLGLGGQTVASEHAIRERHYREMRRGVSFYSKLLKIPGYQSNNYLMRGRCYMELRRFDLAVADFSNSLACDPKNQNALLARAEAYKMLGRSQWAKIDLAKAESAAH